MKTDLKSQFTQYIKQFQEKVLPNLNVRQIALIGTAVWLVVSILAIKYWIAPQKTKLQQLSNKAHTAESNMKVLNNELTKMATSITKVLRDQETDMQMANRYTSLSSSQMMEKLLKPLQDFNLNLVTVRFTSPTKEENKSYSTSQVNLTVSGEYWMLLEYLYLVRDSDVLTDYSQVSLSKVSEAEPVTLQLEMKVYLF